MTDEEIAGLIVGVHEGSPVFLRDLATIRHGPAQPEQLVWMVTGTGADGAMSALGSASPAVTLAVAKKPGTNAVKVADEVIERGDQLLVGAAPNAIAYDSKQFSTGEFFLYGIPASILLMIVTGFAVFILWPIMGMPVTTGG